MCKGLVYTQEHTFEVATTVSHPFSLCLYIISLDYLFDFSVNLELSNVKEGGNATIKLLGV